MKMEEIKKKIDNKNMGIGDRINITLGLLKEDDTYDNRIEVMANLQVMKEIIESHPGLKDLSSNSVSPAGEININGNNNINSTIQSNCNKLINKIKGYKEIQNNPELVKIFNILQNQVKNIKSSGGNIQGQTEETQEPKKTYEDKDIQTEKLDDEEFDKMKFIYEREKRILQLQIDDKTNENNYLNKQVEQLEKENKNLKDKIPFDEKKAIEMNLLLESNLKDLRKKLELSQSERLCLENQCNTYVKSMKDKNELIKSLEKQLKEMRINANSNNNIVSQSQMGNIVRKITGGMY
jgi:hypothetical protein